CTYLLLFLSTVLISFFFFFNESSSTEIYTLSLHDALPISGLDWANRGTSHIDFKKDETVPLQQGRFLGYGVNGGEESTLLKRNRDRKSTRLNSSHSQISYAVFCLKKKKKKK